MLVQGDDDLAVRAALEPVACRPYEFLADTIVVVQLAVDDGVDLVVRVVEGLRAIGAKVVDGKAAVAQGCVEDTGTSQRGVVSRGIRGFCGGAWSGICRTNALVMADPLAAGVGAAMRDHVDALVELLGEFLGGGVGVDGGAVDARGKRPAGGFLRLVALAL